MLFKDESSITDLWVDIDGPNEGKIRVFGESLNQLIVRVERELANFDSQGYAYLPHIDNEARKLGLQRRPYISNLIQHQICKRQPYPSEVCFDQGVGDSLSIAAKKIDDFIDGKPEAVKKIIRKIVKGATLVATGKSHDKLSDCQICSGTISISPEKSNLGRAGVLNNIFNKK